MQQTPVNLGKCAGDAGGVLTHCRLQKTAVPHDDLYRLRLDGHCCNARPRICSHHARLWHLHSELMHMESIVHGLLAGRLSLPVRYHDHSRP